MIRAVIERSELGFKIYLYEHCGDDLAPSESGMRQIAVFDVDEVKEITTAHGRRLSEVML